LHKIDESIRDRYPKIEWKKIAGMRDILIHHYEEANIDMIWKTIQEDIPALLTQITHILKTVEKQHS